jgi:hypothetical protein
MPFVSIVSIVPIVPIAFTDNANTYLWYVLVQFN